MNTETAMSEEGIIEALKLQYTNDKLLPFYASDFKLLENNTKYTFSKRCKGCRHRWAWDKVHNSAQLWEGSMFKVGEGFPADFFKPHTCKPKMTTAKRKLTNIEKAPEIGDAKCELTKLDKAPKIGDADYADFYSFVSEIVKQHRSSYVRSLKFI